MSSIYANEKEIRKTLSVIKDRGGLFEIRIIKGRHTTVGYFRDVSLMLSEMGRLDLQGANVYLVLNEINAACEGREAKDRFVYGATSTSDKDIVSRKWLFIDIDPVRPKDTSATDAQVNLARHKANKVYTFLKNSGFNEPVCGFSGNGCHLLYRIEMPNDTESEKLIKAFLKTLDVLFTDESIKIDVVNYNASRICKLYGTVAQKGTSTSTQPHRMSQMLSCPREVKPTGAEYIRKIVEMLPSEPDRPQAYNSYNGEAFDLHGWLAKYGIVFREQSDDEGTKYILEHCPFDPNHKGKDAMIYRRRNGAIGFHCFHDSCAGKTWRDVRMLFEPDAYERKEQQRDWSMFNQFNRDAAPKPKPIVEEGDTPVFESALYILSKPTPEDTFIKTGIHDIDQKLCGLKKSYVSLISGLRGSAKSTILSQIVLNAVDAGNNVAVFSGELTDKNFMRWMYQQAAGKNHVMPAKSEGRYNTPRKTMEKIAKWLDGRFWLYNNDYGSAFEAVKEQFEKAVEEKKLDLLVLDNLMAFDIRSLSQDKYSAQTAFVLSLEKMAKEHNIHIIFVAHPRKAMGFLRLDDVSGTNDLVNAVDNAFIVHRTNKDFRRQTKEMFKWTDDNPLYEATNVIEITKDRENGTQDYFVPLYFEPESRRLKNYEAEYIRYGWEREPAKAQEPVQSVSEAHTEAQAQKPSRSPSDEGFLVYDPQNASDDDLMIPF